MHTAFAVEYENVAKSFGTTQILSDINLIINPGEFSVFVGPSGSGKSTLLRLLAGLESTDSGRTFIGGQEVTRLAPKDRDVAMVFQNYALYPHMSVAENITFGMRIRKEPKPARQAALGRVVGMLQLDGLLDRKPRELSGGQRQRVAMARAIVRNPKVFLMDEPLSNLDAKLRNEVRAAIIEQQKQLGVTTIYVTHDQVEAMTMAHRIVVLRQGRIQQIGTPEQLYRTPQNMFVAGFIGSPMMNFLPIRYQSGRLCFGGGISLPLNALHGLHQALHEVSLPSAPGGEQRLIGGIRPEHIRIGASARKGSELEISVRVLNREMLGPDYILTVEDAAESRLQLRVPSQIVPPAPGGTTSVSFSLEDLHFFNPASQCRIV